VKSGHFDEIRGQKQSSIEQNGTNKNINMIRNKRGLTTVNKKNHVILSNGNMINRKKCKQNKNYSTKKVDPIIW